MKTFIVMAENVDSFIDLVENVKLIEDPTICDAVLEKGITISGYYKVLK